MPLLLVGLEKTIQTFLKTTSSHGGVFTTAVVIEVANALVERHSEQELSHVQF